LAVGVEHIQEREVVTIDVSEPRLGLVRGLLLVIWPHKAGTPKNQSAAFFFQKKGREDYQFGTESMAMMVRASFEQLYLGLSMRTLASWGSNGNSDMIEPSSVRVPSSSRAPR